MSDKSSNSKNNWIYWLIGILVVVAIIIFIFRNRDNTVEIAGAASDSTTVESVLNNNWTGIDDPNIPIADFDEVKDSDLQVRANENYAIYSLKEAILFEPGKYEIGNKGAEKLKRISASAEKRFTDGPIIIYGYTDSTGTVDENKTLALQRANAVKDWLIKYGNVNLDRVTIKAVGEVNPASINSTSQGRLENRKVDIVIRKK